ncbi:Ig-like domain-containing protein [Archangium sp.]|uniref:Ig-like domain-containing protein n=1 Tax=Archangium sp. TaxID=1872627 RepID=UPI002D3C668F|nr:Ig-like domain-containing protein [Archangium sp.]HYO58746.1 Ig-like domain-containing protein [Archangium sp.]
MRLSTRKMISIASLVAATSFTACGTAHDSGEPAEQHPSTSEALKAERESAEREAGKTLARALALSLRDPAMRGLVRAAMAQSLVKEEKVHFNSYVRGPGRALLQAMSRQTGMSVPTLEELLAQAGSLEMYLPVQEHRAAWRGGEELLVATQYRDREEPHGFNLAGNPVLLSAKAPPTTATLVLVPAEDFTVDGTPSRRGLALGRGDLRPQGSSLMLESGVEPLQDSNACLPLHRGVFATSVEIKGSYEDWLRGKPEYEFYLEHVQNGRQQLRCAGAASPAPYSWDMGGTPWTQPFLISWEKDLPRDTGLAMFIYEDDKTECVIEDDRDHVKLTMDTLNASGSEHRTYQVSPGGSTSVSFSHGLVASKTSLASGGDEYVGTVSSSALPIGTTANPFLLKNENQATTGTVYLKYNDVKPALNSIAVQPQPAYLDPGGQTQLTATGSWDNRMTSDLTGCATWASSGTSYVTVDTSGLAQGLRSGGAMLTASYEGKSASVPVTVRCETNNPDCGALRIRLRWSGPEKGAELYVRTPNNKVIHHGNRGPNAGTDWGQMDQIGSDGSTYWPEGFTPPTGIYQICARPNAVPVTAEAWIFVRGQWMKYLEKSFTSKPASEACENGSETNLGNYYYAYSSP